jgi:hypothetical protein
VGNMNGDIQKKENIRNPEMPNMIGYIKTEKTAG